jgi:flagellar motor switch protein FliN/FliY
MTDDEQRDADESAAPPAETPPAGAAVARSLEFVMDIPLSLTVELGRTRLTIGELLTLGPGSVVPLAKLAGEPLEILLNNKLIARGEAVVVNEKLGVRLTEIVGKGERIEKLR